MNRIAVLAAPCALIVATALLGSTVSRATGVYFITALVSVSIVVALYVFIGNSGVLSFGHISFVAIGVWTAGVLTVPSAEKPAIMPNLAACRGCASRSGRRTGGARPKGARHRRAVG